MQILKLGGDHGSFSGAWRGVATLGAADCAQLTHVLQGAREWALMHTSMHQGSFSGVGSWCSCLSGKTGKTDNSKP